MRYSRIHIIRYFQAAFSQLLKELRGEFDKYGLLLTAAVASVEASASLSYIIPDLNQ
jgi:chitinase